MTMVNSGFKGFTGLNEWIVGDTLINFTWLDLAYNVIKMLDRAIVSITHIWYAIAYLI